ncbi:MAG: GlsB/YeaQ/YmgE family stress response membrane protein [Paramuribaculum sp.]|nr:GlsB/YeaQ/YmgE family stress response membrane protein [Paramuribaculum sp.]
MMPETIDFSNWIVWGAIGIIGGYMTGRLLRSGGLSTFWNVIFGIIGAVGGGYAFVIWFGENYYGQTISLLGSVAVCAIVLWLLNLIFPKKKNEEDDI